MHKYKIVKLDGRHKGHGLFDYFVDFQTASSIPRDTRRADFVEMRNWCWEVWGPAQELDFTGWGTEPSWAWWRDGDRASLYFGEQELSVYLLKWG